MTKTKFLVSFAIATVIATRMNLKRFFCGLAGHNSLMEFEKHRMYLWCPDCGWQSPGWDEIGTRK